MSRPLTAALLLAATLAACGPKDWRQARQAGTSASYHTFAVAHPGEPRGAIAARRAASLGWSEAQAANTSEGYWSFARQYPSSEHALEARGLAESTGWAEASAEGTIGAYASFVQRFPESAHVPEAEAQVEALSYAQAKAEGTLASWGQYLQRYPNGPHAQEAWTERERMAWENAVEADRRHAYVKFLEQYPDGPHAEQARSWLGETYVTRLQPVVALIETHAPEPGHAAIIAQARQEVADGLLKDVAPMFAIEPVKTYDGTRGMPHPHQMFGKQAGTGVLVVEIYEKPGEKYEPAAQGYEISAVLRLYAPNTGDAVWVREVTVQTPEKVVGQDATALHRATMDALGDRLRALATELSVQRPEALR
ncbi:MAG: hypothetical protein R3F59_05355 [Myxococcota bacterium]